MITKILFRRGDSDAWIDRNPILESGEPGLDVEARVLKVGNGTSAWVDLPGVSIDGGVSNEVIAQAIESYLAEHPLEGVTQQELEAAVAAVELLPGPKGDKGDTGAASTVPGPKGDTGDTGAASTVPGPKGDKGDKGDTGNTGAASTVPGPKGDKGDKGDTGDMPTGAVISTDITNIEVMTPDQYILIDPQDGVLYILKEEE